MTSGYPTFSPSARKGEAGVNYVAQLANDSFGWIFKRTHQEHDFGVDGQLEVVTDESHVTGQLVAVQIKHGASYFSEKNKWGYVYRGENKHFNYLSNYPVPVLLVICNPATDECLWVQFEPSLTTGTSNGWKITIPFENHLRESKTRILALLPDAVDSLAHLKDYWALNKLLMGSDYTLFAIDSDEVQSCDVSRARSFFDRLRASKELAHSCKATVEFSFSGYDTDPRELFEIPEIPTYMRSLSDALPELLFFLRHKPLPCHTLPLFAFCLGGGQVVGKRATVGMKHRVEFETKPVAEFLMSKWPGLNEMTAWLDMSMDENKELSYDVARCLGFSPPED